MEQKKYTIGNKTLTQSELSLNDGKKVLRLLKDIDWENMATSNKSIYELVVEYLDNNIIEQIFGIILKGEQPKGEVGDWMTTSMAMEIVDDFFSLNALLMTKALNLLSNFQSSGQGSVEPKQKSTD